MIINNKRTVSVKHNYECSAATLFKQWTPENMVSWWPNLKRAEFPKTVGEKLRFEWHNFDGFVEGEVKELVDGKSILFSWISSRTGNQSQVRFNFEDNPEGSRLSIIHDHNQDFEDASCHNEGWTYCLNHLGKSLDKKQRARDVKITRTFNAPIEMVFDAWSTPEHMSRWMNDGINRDAICEAKLEVGGDFRIDYNDQEGKIHPHYGTYKKIDRPNQLVFTWVSDYTNGETEVTVNLKENGKDKTDLELVHRFFRNEDEAQDHREGWGHCSTEMEKMFTEKH